MANWSGTKVNASDINGGKEYERKDRVSREQFNAIVNNSLYAQAVSEEALEKANSAFEANGTIVSISGSPQPYISFDADPQSQLNAKYNTEIIYDMSDSEKDFGISGGITHNASIEADFSKYKKVICHGQRDYEGFSVEVDLRHKTPASNQYTGYNMYFAVYSDSKPYVRICGGIVDSAKSKFTAYFEQKVLASGNNNSSGYFTMIEGVF